MNRTKPTFKHKLLVILIFWPLIPIGFLGIAVGLVVLPFRNGVLVAKDILDWI